MASPDVFKSSPMRVARRESPMTISSSPDLPSLQDILSQKQIPPPLRSGSRAAAIPDDAPTSFTKASSLWKSAQAQNTTTSPSPRKEPEPIIEIDAPGPVTGVGPPTKSKPCKAKQRKDKPAADTLPDAQEPFHGQPWKKYKANSNDEVHGGKANERDGAAECRHPARSKPREQTGTMSSHSTRKPATKTQQAKAGNGGDLGQSPPEARRQKTGEPLQLEQAAARRLDWTPPKQQTPVVIDSDSPAIEGAQHSTTDDPQPSVFANLLNAYGCKDSAPPPVVATTEDDVGFQKKRKRIEFVATSAAAVSAVPEKSPTKQKAPKKKPRTITGLATAAYETAASADSAMPPGSLHDFFPSGGQEGGGDRTDGKEKAPAKSRKRASKATKEKPKAAKPVLLSPRAALRQVANQDFVFGTSSQLATEHSPTFLRDLQGAMRHSNQLEGDSFVTPINSDAIEPPEQRAKLWDAGARDEDGDLFDLEVVNLADGSPQLPAMRDDSDPFGYVRGEDEAAGDSKPRETEHAQTEDSFVDLSDILRPRDAHSVEVIDADTPGGGIEISAGTEVRGSGVPAAQVQRKGSRDPEVLAGEQVGIIEYNGIEPQSCRLPYGAFSGLQSSKETATSGLKAAKKRSAMNPLLDQSCQAGMRPIQGSVSTAAAMSTAATAVGDQETGSSVSKGNAKRARGRPRKDRTAGPDVQEPPPSAQPPANSKRPRGRPRKDAASPSRAAAKTPKSKKKSHGSPEKAARAVMTDKSGEAPPRVVLEIPDSASELSASPRSSPEPTFSPPAAADLSLSLDEDTELSLTLSPTEQQVPLFTHITKAITTTPRTTDPENPSWHEKILLYDPIVLEDLTEWLNSGQLAGVGYDGSVAPSDVKKWCESKSVCCLWKANTRGKERKYY